jgi:outer membrane protein TolC
VIDDLYLSAQSAQARAEAAQTRVTDSTTLYQLAEDKHDTGTATGVDVLRDEVQLANDKQALLVAQPRYQQALLTLARNLGMNPATPPELAESLRYQPLTEPEAEAVVALALLGRPDYLSLASQGLELVQQQRANHAHYFPS